MGIKQIKSRADFFESIGEGVALVDFSAPWCAPCKLQQPIIGRLASAYHKRASVYEINVDRFQEIAVNFKIHSVPTLIIFKDGQEIERVVGLQTEAVLAEVLDRALKKYVPKKGSDKRR